MLTALHSHDLGDIIYSLPSIKASGKARFLLNKTHAKRLPLMKKLLEAQDYISSCELHNREEADLDFLHFRKAGLTYGVSLGRLQSNWVKASPNFSLPWLKVPPSSEATGKILVNKTPRYGNPFFPWRDLVHRFRTDMLFVGLSEEHTDFCRRYGEVPYLHTNDLYDLATAIRGSELFIGNQSSAMAICLGLAHPCIQEVCLPAPDCIYPRKNAIYCYDGALEFECLGKEFRKEGVVLKPRLDPNTSPNGGWRLVLHSKTYRHFDLTGVVEQARQELLNSGKVVPVNLREMVIEQTAKDTPLPPSEKRMSSQMRQIEGLVKAVDTLSTKDKNPTP